MIFNTITNDLNGAINKIGIFNRSFADLKNAISANGIKGLFNSISPTITSNELSIIKEYNRLVGVEGVSSQTAWYRTMLSSSRSAQALFDDENNLIETNNGLILSEEALTQATNTMSIGAKAGRVALKGLAIAGNMILFAAIATEIAKEKAHAFGESARNSMENIADNKSTLSGLNEEYQKLSKGVTDLGTNGLHKHLYLKRKGVIL